MSAWDIAGAVGFWTLALYAGLAARGLRWSWDEYHQIKLYPRATAVAILSLSGAVFFTARLFGANA